jgi:general secretion pathway protein G
MEATITSESTGQIRRAGSVGGARRRGFTLMELMLTLAVFAVLMVVAIPSYRMYVLRAQNSAALADIGQIQMAVGHYAMSNDGNLPADLATVKLAAMVDPWGNPYYYHTTVAGTGNGVGRKDKSLHPINTDFDLYSSGPDGQSVAPLTAKPSHDDIIRANDGNFLGVAANY